MKLDLITGAAVAVAGLAVYSFARSNKPAAPSTGADMAFAMATQQRRDSGAAQWQNVAYLGEWRDVFHEFGTSTGDDGAWV